MMILIIVGVNLAIVFAVLCGLYAIGRASLNEESRNYEELYEMLEKIEESVNQVYLYLAEKDWKEDMDDGSDDLPKFGD